jgi:hypothetical protein
MGGYGSGRWGGKGRQCTAEECYKLDVRSDSLRAQLSQHLESEVMLKLVTTHSIPGKPSIVIQGEYLFTSTSCRYGGVRWWFRCPTCTRRCAVLYRPTYRHRFVCRQCNHLTYTSAQEAHKWDRSRLGTLAAGIDFRDRLDNLIRQRSRHRIGSKAWLRIDQRIDRLMGKLDGAMAASRARSAALKAGTMALFALYGAGDE